jgi:hypothetical protein
MIAVVDRKRCMGRTEFLTWEDYDASRGWIGHSIKSEMALFFECMPESARKSLDTADIVIALGKLGRGGTEDETVKLLDGIQRV